MLLWDVWQFSEALDPMSPLKFDLSVRKIPKYYFNAKYPLQHREILLLTWLQNCPILFTPKSMEETKKTNITTT